jgi:hypothetical protein
VFLRIAAVTALIVGLMAVIADGRVLERAGLVGRCTAVAAPSGGSGSWQACRSGKLEGRPDLSRQSCVSEGISGTVEYWRCPEKIVVSPAPRG